MGPGGSGAEDDHWLRDACPTPQHPEVPGAHKKANPADENERQDRK